MSTTLRRAAALGAFPSDAIVIVLRSIRNTDKFVGQLRPFIDGTTGA